MKIKYTKKHLNHNLIFGILWLIFSLSGLMIKNEPYWTDYGFFVISILYLGIYFYERRKQYLTLENGVLKVNGPFGKRLNLYEIKRIRRFAGDYIIKTDTTELTINTQLIEPNSLVELNTELEKLNIEWN